MSPSSPLPPRPDFDGIEAEAEASSPARTAVLALIGNLVFMWSNNESLFIYVIMVLLEVDEVSATIVFSTLNTTRARLDLVQRLARVKIRGDAAARRLDELVERFNECTRVRNEFNHAMFSVNEHGEIVATQSLRLHESRGHLRFGQPSAMDEARLTGMAEVVNELRRLNRDLWDFLPELKQAVARGRVPATEA